MARGECMLEQLLFDWMWLGVGLPALFAAGELVRPARPGRLLMAALYLCIALIQWCWLWLLSDRIAALPALLFLTQPALMLVGPLLYLFFRRLGDGGFRWARACWHLLPALLVLGWALYALGAWRPGQPLHQPAPLMALSGFGGAAYMLALVRELWRLRSRRLIRAQLGLLLSFASIGAMVGVAALVTDLARADAFYLVYLSVIPLAMAASYLFHMRYPELLQAVSEEAAAQRRYQKSQLGNVDVASVVRRLEQLMEEERLFADETLGLASLAGALGISSHQLSELFNEQLQTGFSRYLRERRVREARRLLVEEPDEAVLDIGLRCGFNSSSAFYAAFRDVAGMAPGRYRRQFCPSGQSGNS